MPNVNVCQGCWVYTGNYDGMVLQTGTRIILGGHMSLDNVQKVRQ